MINLKNFYRSTNFQDGKKEKFYIVIQPVFSTYFQFYSHIDFPFTFLFLFIYLFIFLGGGMHSL